MKPHIEELQKPKQTSITVVSYRKNNIKLLNLLDLCYKKILLKFELELLKSTVCTLLCYES